MSTINGQCKLCGEIIAYTEGDPFELGFHMMERHSDTIGQYSPVSCPKTCFVHADKISNNINYYCKPERPKKIARRPFRSKRGMYKTTLESWTSATGYVDCPSCGKRVKPLIRSQKNKVAYTSVGAAFLLSCWPFCFLFPLMHKCSMDLYCPYCKRTLGIYDSTSGSTNTKPRTPNITQ